MGLGPELSVFSNFSIRFFNAIGSILHLFQHRHAASSSQVSMEQRLASKTLATTLASSGFMSPIAITRMTVPWALAISSGVSILGNASAIGRDLRVG